jgi:hypothetical protein
MSKIGKARGKIKQIASELRSKKQENLADQLENIVDNMMYRRKPARRMRSHSQPVTDDIREEVLELARTTKMHSAEIAVKLNLNPGRVSEILQGDR